MKKGNIVVCALLFSMVWGQITLGDGELLIRTQANPYVQENIILSTSAGSYVSPPDDRGVHFMLDILPGGFLISPDIDGFTVANGWRREEIEGYGSWMPNMRAGININTRTVDYDITGGGGYLWNEAFSAPLVVGDFAARFKIGDFVTLGPHIGLVHFNSPEWDGRVNVDFSDSTGLMGGVALTIGKKNVFASISVDYISASFDVENRQEVYVNDDELDISGLGVQLGLILRF